MQPYQINPEQYKSIPTTITLDSLNSLKSSDPVSLTCKICNKDYTQAKELVIKSIKKFSNCGYCSRDCSNKSKRNKVSTQCKQCDKNIVVRYAQFIKNKNCFCSYTCGTKHRNANKTSGHLRSKMEIYLEGQLLETYPTLEMEPNNRKLLNGLELDFYFPTLKLAFELNGITHYEPIYGLDRFARSQDCDNRKMAMCHEKGIELAVIDISSIKYFKEKSGSKIFEEFKRILEPLVNYLSNNTEN